MDEREAVSKAVLFIQQKKREGLPDHEIKVVLQAMGIEKETAEKLISLSGKASSGSSGDIFSDVKKRKGQKNILFGCLWFFGGTIVTFATLSGGSHYVVFYGAIIGGLIQLIMGIVQVSTA